VRNKYLRVLGGAFHLLLIRNRKGRNSITRISEELRRRSHGERVLSLSEGGTLLKNGGETNSRKHPKKKGGRDEVINLSKEEGVDEGSSKELSEGMTNGLNLK